MISKPSYYFLTGLRMLFLVFALSLYSGGEEAYSQDKPAIWLVLDCSGSMWGRTPAGPKYRIALDLIGATLRSYPEAEYGFMVFGRRERSDCGDIEILVRPAPGSADSIQSLLGKIRPNGKSPIGKAFETLGNSVDSTRENFAVFVSDGIEACGGNPAEEAQKLSESGRLKAIHTVWFPGIDGDSLSMRLIAEISGGSFHSAPDTSPAADWIVRSRTPVIPEEIPAPPPPPQYGLIGYKAFIRQEDGFPAFGTLAQVKLEDSTVLAEKAIWKGIIEEVPPGNYTVEVTNSDSTLIKACTVRTNGMTYLPFVFDIPTGGITYRCIVNGSEQIHAYNSLVQVFHASGEVVFTGNQWQGAVQNLPEGMYKLTASNRDIIREEEIRVTRNDSTETVFDFPLETGRLSFECYLDSARQKPAYGVRVRLFSLPFEELVMDDSTRWRGQSPQIPSGRYIVSANFFGQIINHNVELLPNDNFQELVIFNVEQVRFSYECYRSDTNNPANGAEVRVINPGGVQVEQATGWRGSFLIPAGRYTFIARYQEQEIQRAITLVPSFSAKSPEKIYFP